MGHVYDGDMQKRRPICTALPAPSRFQNAKLLTSACAAAIGWLRYYKVLSAAMPLGLSRVESLRNRLANAANYWPVRNGGLLTGAAAHRFDSVTKQWCMSLQNRRQTTDGLPDGAAGRDGGEGPFLHERPP